MVSSSNCNTNWSHTRANHAKRVMNKSCRIYCAKHFHGLTCLMTRSIIWVWFQILAGQQDTKRLLWNIVCQIDFTWKIFMDWPKVLGPWHYPKNKLHENIFATLIMSCMLLFCRWWVLSLKSCKFWWCWNFQEQSCPVTFTCDSIPTTR